MCVVPADERHEPRRRLAEADPHVFLLEPGGLGLRCQGPWIATLFFPHMDFAKVLDLGAVAVAAAVVPLPVSPGWAVGRRLLLP